MSINEQLDRGEIVSIGEPFKMYRKCDCGKIVQINKPFFGSLHVCNIIKPERRCSITLKRKNFSIGFTNVADSDKYDVERQLKKMARRMSFNMFKDKITNLFCHI